MPNIEIHGMPMAQARKLRSDIWEVFRGSPYLDEMVVTIFPTEVKDRKGRSQPFVRLANSCQEHTPEIILVLNHMGMGMDVEHLKLEAFVPRKKTKRKGSG